MQIHQRIRFSGMILRSVLPCLSVFFLLLTGKSVAQPYTTIELKKEKPYDNRTLPSEKSGNKKFTLPKRIYNNTVTHFNYYFNANQRMNEIVGRATESHRDDYTQLLSFYDYDLETTAQDQIDTVLYKCTAGILLHDLRSDWVDNLYLLMGKAYLFRKDFDSALHVFQYINYAFAPKDDGYDVPIGSNAGNAGGVFTISTNEKRNLWKKMTTTLPSRNESFLWMARTYIEQDKMAEASGLIALIRSDALFPSRLQPELDEASAYLFYKLNAYDSAAFYLTRSLKKGNDLQDKARTYYLAAQLYERANKNNDAIKNFTEAIRYAKDPFMEVYARLNIAALATGEKDNAVQENLNELLKMAKKDKYDVYRDIIYYAAAKLELSRKAYPAAQQWLLKSVAYSSDNPIQKQKSFLLLGDLNYDRKAYSQSFRFYDSVEARLLPPDEQLRIETRKPALQLISINEENIAREDSVQKIAALSETARTDFLKKLLRQIRKERGIKESDEPSFGADLTVDNKTSGDLFGNSNTDFYFQNGNLKSRGLSEFNRRWGNRPNVDNWRRQSAIDKVITTQQTQASILQDGKTEPKREELSLESLLNVIPLTQEQKELSNTIIIRALLNNGKIFHQQLDDYASAIEVYEELLRRFPQSSEAEETSFLLIQCYRKTNNLKAADSLSLVFNSQYSDSKFLYGNTVKNKQQDPKEKLYSNIYDLFIEGKFEAAIQAKKQAEKTLNSSEWTPQLLYIESIYYIKERKDSTAIHRLEQLITNFPTSPLAEKATTMIDVLKRRNEIEGYLSGLNVERPVETVTRSVDLSGPANVITSTPQKKDSVATTPAIKDLKQPGLNITNAVQSPVQSVELDYEFVATDTQYAVVVLNKVDGMFAGEARNAFNRFNQERFFNKRLSILTQTILPEVQFLLIGPFKDANEAVGYTDVVKPLAPNRIVPWLSTDKYGFLIISPANLRLLQTKKDAAAYRAFLQKILPDKF